MDLRTATADRGAEHSSAPSDPRRAGELLEQTIRAALARTRGLTMAGLARQAKVGRGTLYLWFSGRQTPSGPKLEAIAAILGVPMTDLWDAYLGRDSVGKLPSLEAAIMALIGRLDREEVMRRDRSDFEDQSLRDVVERIDRGFAAIAELLGERPRP